LQSYGLDGRTDGPTTIEGMASLNIREMRKVAPDGPYHLVGYSSGGKLAWEMAAQLTSAGEQVAMLGLLDTSILASRAGYGARLRNRIGQVRRNPRARLVGYTHEYSRRARRWLLRRLRQSLPANADMPTIFKNVALVSSEAMKKYQLNPFGGPVVLFRAENGSRKTATSEDLGWTRYATGGLTILDIPGEHDTLLKLPYVTDVARQIDAALDAAKV
jgi:thioesterase domain-containing protein